MNTRERLAANLRRLRGKKGWRQDEAALAAGRLSARIYAEMERAAGNPRLSTLESVAKAYGVKVVDLLK